MDSLYTVTIISKRCVRTLASNWSDYWPQATESLLVFHVVSGRGPVGGRTSRRVKTATVLMRPGLLSAVFLSPCGNTWAEFAASAMKRAFQELQTAFLRDLILSTTASVCGKNKWDEFALSRIKNTSCDVQRVERCKRRPDIHPISSLVTMKVAAVSIETGWCVQGNRRVSVYSCGIKADSRSGDQKHVVMMNFPVNIIELNFVSTVN